MVRVRSKVPSVPPRLTISAVAGRQLLYSCGAAFLLAQRRFTNFEGLRLRFGLAELGRAVFCSAAGLVYVNPGKATARLASSGAALPRVA